MEATGNHDDSARANASAEICLDLSGRIVSAVGIVAPLIGNDIAAAIGRPIFDFVAAESQGNFIDAFQRALGGARVPNGSFRFTASGDPLRLEFVSTAGQSDQPASSAVCLRDVTVAQREKDINTLSRDLFNSALDELREGVIVYDADFHVTQINDALISALGLESLPPEALETASLARGFPGLVPDAAEFQQIIESGREHHTVARVRTARGIDTNLILNLYPVRDATGRVAQVVETVHEFAADQETAGRLQQLYRRQQEKVRILSVLNKLSNDFAVSTDEEELYPRITRTLVWGLGLHDTVAVLSIRNPDTGQLTLRSLFGLDTWPFELLMDKPPEVPEFTVIGEEMERLVPHLFELGLRSAIYAPIIVEGQNAGWINIFHRSREPQISEEETLVRILTENLKHFIRRWNAERLLREKVLTLLILRQVSDALQVGKSRDHIAYTFLTGVTAEEGVGFNRAFLFLLEDEEERLSGAMAVGPATPFEAGEIWNRLRREGNDFSDLLTDFDKIESLTKTELNTRVRACEISWNPDSQFFNAFESKSPHILHRSEVTDDGERQALEQLGCEDFVIAPLFATDRPLGVLVADNMITRTPIRGEDLRFLELMCKAGQAALENIKLYEELQSKIESLKRSNVLMQEHRARLAQLERLGAVGEMATTVAHEIRNPLVVIGGFARSLFSDLAPEDASRKYLQIIIDEVARLETVVTDLLDFAKPMTPRFRAVPIRDLIQQSVSIVEPEFNDAGVRIVTRLVRPSVLAWVDPDQIKHVLLNLMQNALNAMPGGGRLTIFARTGKEMLHIGLRDNGCGIPAENLEKIFEPFFTTRSAGTGLGLPIVQKIIRSHGGRISVKSVVGRGTTFLMSLPYGEMKI